MKYTGKSHKLAKLQKISKVGDLFGDILAAKVGELWFSCDFKISSQNKIDAVKCSRNPIKNIHILAKLENADDKLTDPTFNRS